MTRFTKGPGPRGPPTENDVEKARFFALDNGIDYASLQKKVNDQGELLEIETTDDVLFDNFLRITIGMTQR